MPSHHALPPPLLRNGATSSLAEAPSSRMKAAQTVDSAAHTVFGHACNLAPHKKCHNACISRGRHFNILSSNWQHSACDSRQGTDLPSRALELPPGHLFNGPLYHPQPRRSCHFAICHIGSLSPRWDYHGGFHTASVSKQGNQGLSGFDFSRLLEA
jgi:hypothetical protein